MSETEQKAQYLKFTPDEGFDLRPVYLKDVARVARTSPAAVKKDVVCLLEVLPIRERAAVLENLLKARSEKRRRKG